MPPSLVLHIPSLGLLSTLLGVHIFALESAASFVHTCLSGPAPSPTLHTLLGGRCYPHSAHPSALAYLPPTHCPHSLREGCSWCTKAGRHDAGKLYAMKVLPRQPWVQRT